MSFDQQRTLSNDGAILALGICSIVFSCWGIIGLGLSIAVLIMSKNSLKEYYLTPGEFKASSYGNVNAGRVCAIIGVVISSLSTLFFILYFLLVVLEIVVLGAALNLMNV